MCRFSAIVGRADFRAIRTIRTNGGGRRLAASIDLDRLSEEVGGSIAKPANGPFPPGSRGYLEDTGYPAYDLDAANEYMDTCLEEQGSDSISFSFNTTNDPFNVETNTLITSMWQEAFGNKVSADITPIEQGSYIGLALTGDFQVFGWRNHGGSDPDQQLLWWYSASAAPIGSQALDFGRFSDEVAARTLGTRNLRIIGREVLPDVLPAMFSFAFLGLAVLIIVEAALAFFGVGDVSGVSWGIMIQNGRSQIDVAPHMVLFPSIFMFLTILSLNFVGDQMRRRFDVRESGI